MCATNKNCLKSKIKYLFKRKDNCFKFISQILIIIFLLWMFSLSSLVDANDMTDEWKYPENCSDLSCDYKAKWQYLENTDEIKFVISTRFRNKWTGIGFSDNKQMKGTDAVIGLVEENGRYFLMDTYLGAYQTPPLDAVQNIHNMSVWRENGITHLRFYRFRKTSDPQYDFQFSDQNCAYFHFPVKGGVYNAVSKRLRKHEETPIVSKEKICIRAQDYLTRKKQNQENLSNVLNRLNKPKNKIPIRFKFRTKPSMITTNKLPNLSTELPISNTSTKSLSSNLNNLEKNKLSNKQNPVMTTISYAINLLNFTNRTFNNMDSIQSSTNVTLSNIINTDSTTVSSTLLSSSLPNSSSSFVDFVLTTTKMSVNQDENLRINEEKVDYTDDEEEINENEQTNSNNISHYFTSTSKNEYELQNNNLNKKNNLIKNYDQTNENNNGRIRTNLDIKNNMQQVVNFELKIFDKNQLNLNDVQKEASKELSDLTGFKQLKVLYLNKTNEMKKDKMQYLALLQLELQAEPGTNETDYLGYIVNQLNETVYGGQLGTLELDPGYFHSFIQDTTSIQTDLEARYVFEYNLFNHFNVKLTKKQVKIVYIICGVLLLIILVFIQACCICLNSSSSNNNIHKQNNLSNSSTLQDKHKLNIYHQYHDHTGNGHLHSNYSQLSNPYAEYMKTESNGAYSYENFAMEPYDNFDLYNSSRNNSKIKNSSLIKKENMYDNNYKRNSQNRHDFCEANNLNRNRYFESTNQITNLQPDFYFMPHQRRYSSEIVRMFVNYNDAQFVSK